MLIILFPFVRWVALAAFQAEPDVEHLARDYFNARIWGAPALLMGFVMSGWLLGTGRTRELLAFQIVLNGINAGLDTWFVAGLGWGPAGIGAGTAIAEWAALGFGFLMVRHGLRAPARLFDHEKLLAFFTANRDIMIRTLALTFSFAWFVNAGTRAGTAQLAGNEVLLQFITVSAFVLDSFAFIAEKEAGEAFGAGDKTRLVRAMRITTELAAASGAAIAILFYFGGGIVINIFIADMEAREAALAYLPYCAVVPFIGVAAWQMDGIFLGTTRGQALRTAGLVAMLLYIALDFALARFGNTGVWLALLGMYVIRAVCLGMFLPGLMRDINRGRLPQLRPLS